jgi:methylphosphotriester-DNA--protein-cysteine methyltransferase
VKVAGQENLHRSQLGMETNLAAEDHGCPEHLTRVREADIGLKLHTEVQTAADQVDTAKRVLENSDASVLDITLRDADTLVGCS